MSIQGTTEAQAVKLEALIKLEVLTMNCKLFNQIEVPVISGDRDKAIVRAKNEGLATVIRPDEGNTLWLICSNASGLYRWQMGRVESMPDSMLWLQELPQVFIK